MQMQDVTRLKILGMTNKSGNSLVRHSLKRVPNVENVAVDEVSGVAMVLHAGAPLEALIEAVHGVGFGAYRLWTDELESPV